METTDERTRKDLAGQAFEESHLEEYKHQIRNWNWGRIGIGVGAAAAVAGAAFASRKIARNGSGGSSDYQYLLETDENVRLISSRKVEGTPVVDRDGTKIGAIDSFMVDKYSGRVAYAVMSFGGTFGFGASLFPLPWPLLDYDEEKGGYMLDLTKEDLAEAPRFEPSDQPEFNPEYRRRVILFYRPASAGNDGAAAGASEAASSPQRPTVSQSGAS